MNIGGGGSLKGEGGRVHGQGKGEPYNRGLNREEDSLLRQQTVVNG